jgi:hypothetical protein
MRCSVCSLDEELYGTEPFRISKPAIMAGQQPCGCSKCPKRNSEQFKVLLNRKATLLGYTFIGFAQEYKGKTTKISLSCNKHGVWTSGIISNFLHRSIGCPECKKELVSKRFRKPDHEMVEVLNSLKLFPEGTTFTRTDEKTKSGQFLWRTSCPVCEGYGISDYTSLKKGSRSCDCKKQNPTQSYINLINDAGLTIALKFGVSKNAANRLIELRKDSVFEVEPFAVFNFTNSKACRAAEQECLRVLECGILSKQEIDNGFTETTYTYNLEKIVSIFKSFGGEQRTYGGL